MNPIILLSMALLPLGVFAQSQSQRIENARFQVTVNNESAYSTHINSQSGVFGTKEFLQLERDLLEKEGIFDVVLLNDKKTIRIDHLSYIEVETLKQFVLPYRAEIEIEEKVPYLF